MPNAPAWSESNFRDKRLSSNTFKRVFASYTAATLATVWSPASGTKFRLKGGYLTVACTTLCNGSETAGNLLVLVDSAANTPIVTLGVIMTDDLAPGSAWPGVQGTDTAILTTNTYTSVTMGGGLRFDLAEGYTSSTANNILKFAIVDATPAAVNVNSGVFVVSGVVWGNEVSGANLY